MPSSVQKVLADTQALLKQHWAQLANGAHAPVSVAVKH